MDQPVKVTLPLAQNFENKLSEDMYREAETNALRIIQDKLAKPEDLQKLDQLRTAATQRKHILDEQLHIAVQSQLGSIKTGIAELRMSVDNLQTVEQTIHEIDKKLQKIAAIEPRLEALRQESNIYRQLSFAQANLDQIMQIPENVKQANELMEEGKLLPAHQLIMEIEKSRNYLLFELHKAEENDAQIDDTQLVINCFVDYESLHPQLRQLTSLIISRWYDCAISAPEKLVTALRIIEREEQVDRFWMERKELTGFSPPERPRQWKKLCFELLRKSVKDRIEENQLETRDEHNYWLARHLEMCRLVILRDFRIITKSCLHCFPKQYDIVNRFLGYYHNCMKEHLIEICDPKRRTEGDALTVAEVYALVTFVHGYLGVEGLGDPELHLNVGQLSPLLEKDILAAITDTFVNGQKQKLTEWMPKILALEVKDWNELKEVELPSDLYYVTDMPRILIGMITEMLDMAKGMSDETCQSILDMIVQKVHEFRDSYVAEIKNYAERYFADRNTFKESFTKQMTANANNCESMLNFIRYLRRKYDCDDLENLLHSSHQQLDRYDNLGKKFERTGEYCCEIILQEIELDTSEFLQALFTNEWFGSKAKPCCRTIVETTRDYWSSELTHLKKTFLIYIIYTWHKHILAYYLRNLFSRQTSIKFAKPFERQTGAGQLRAEAMMLDQEFKTWSGTSIDNVTEYHFNILSSIADILEQTDPDSIVLEMATLARKYPSLTIDQLTQVLLVRGDFTKAEAKDKANAALPNVARVNHDVLFEIMEIASRLNQKFRK